MSKKLVCRPVATAEGCQSIPASAVRCDRVDAVNGLNVPAEADHRTHRDHYTGPSVVDAVGDLQVADDFAHAENGAVHPPD